MRGMQQLLMQQLLIAAAVDIPAAVVAVDSPVAAVVVDMPAAVDTGNL